MESIERFGPSQRVDIGAADENIATMREFLATSRVTRDFQDVKADARRLHSARQADSALARLQSYTQAPRGPHIRKEETLTTLLV